MKKKKLFRKLVSTALCLTLAMGLFTGCSKADSNSTKKINYQDKKVLRVGMECAYAPFNWTQETDTLSNGDKAVPIYGTNLYCYGYDVMMAKKIADKLGWDLEIHKVEWDSIGLSMDAGDYDCIIGGMSWSEEREAAYDFTSEYYFRDVISQIPDAKQAAFYETTSEAFMAVSNGVADAALIDVPTSESALLTNSDLEILKIDDIESGSSVNVCIAVRTGDKELQNLIQGALDDLNWNEENRAQMDEMMSLAVSLQPAAK